MKFFSKLVFYYQLITIVFFCHLSHAMLSLAPCINCQTDTEKTCSACKEPVCRNCVIKPFYKDHTQTDRHKKLDAQLIRKISTLPDAGDGLFAKTSIAANAAIAIYSGTPYQTTFELPFDFESHFEADTHSRHPYTQEIATVTAAGTLKRNINHYILGDTQPRTLGLFAQGANDPAISAEEIRFLKNIAQEEIPDEDLEKLSDIFEKYFYNNIMNPSRNAMLKNEYFSEKFPFPYLVSTRKIAQGEEIFHSYGTEYWANIPYWNCFRKGLLLNSVKILKSISEGLEKAEYTMGKQADLITVDFKTFQKNLNNPKPDSIYATALRDLKQALTLYQTQENIERVMQFHSNPERLLPITIPGLFVGTSHLLLFISHKKTANSILETIHYKKRLKEIAQLPEKEFFQGVIENTASTLSKALLADLLNEAEKHPMSPFQFYIPKLDPATGGVCAYVKNGPPSEQIVSPDTLRRVLKLSSED